MDWNDGASHRCEFRLHLRRINVEPFVFDIGKSWLGACVDYCVRCCEERERGCYNLVALFNSHRLEGDLKSRRTRSGRHRIASATISGEFLLELVHTLSHDQLLIL